MADFTIQNIGATTYAKDNGNGTYTVTSKGTRCGEKPVVQILDAQEVEEKFGKYLDKTPATDVFTSSKAQSGKFEEFTQNMDDFFTTTSPIYAWQKYQTESFFDTFESIFDGTLKEDCENRTLKDNWNHFLCQNSPWAAWQHYRNENNGGCNYLC